VRPVILLDGAMATQLSARGFELRGPLFDRTTPSPGFSARALLDQPELVAAIHHDYLRAGAQVLTTNSFGLHASTLAEAGIAQLQGPLVARSVEILTAVRHAVRQHEPELARFRVAGSIPPRPHTDWSGEPELAAAQYRGLAEQLALAGADLILLETFTTCAEARLALAGVAELGLPIWLSIVAGAPTGQRQPDGTRLIGGEAIAELAPLLDQVDALLINCTQIDAVPAALDALAQLGHAHPTLPLGLSPHFGKRRHDGVWVERIVDSDPFAAQIQAWLDRPSRARFELIGACCGSAPEDIASIRARLQADPAARELGWTRLAELVP
jgi:homocysteine S-methyltransferase